MKIVVVGGTGLIGAKVVEKLKQKGHEAIAAAPNTGVNTITGEGLADALAGAQVVVDVANSPSFEDQAAMDFFQTAGKNLATAEVAAGIKHHVALSVVGTERLLDSGYFRAKLAQEKNAPIPYTIVRATQFFEFLRGIAQSAIEGDTVRLSHSLFQPMAAEDAGGSPTSRRRRRKSNRSHTQPQTRAITEKETHHEEDCTSAYGCCRFVGDEPRRPRDDRSGSERIRRF